MIRRRKLHAALTERNIPGGGGTTTGGGGGGGGTDPVPPAMPLVAPTGWVRQADTDFDIPVIEGQFASSSSGYWGNPSADDRGRMQFSAYSGGDSRSKKSKSITVTTTAGSANVTSTGAFTAANYCYQGINNGSPSTYGGSYIELANVFSSNTRFLTVTDTSNAVLNKPALQGGTFTVTTRPDHGTYDVGRYSVANGKCVLRLGTTTDGVHHVGALRPKLNNTASTWNVAAGAFEYCMRVVGPIPGYKQAPLLWPQSKTNGIGGEIDFGEENFDGGGSASLFVHYYTDSTKQFVRNSTTDVVSTTWHRHRLEWLPNPSTPSLSTVKYFIDGVQVGTTIQDAEVPYAPMHWIWQVESNLNYTTPIPDESAGTVEYAWALFDNPA